jgi:small-conductance mechanosensitive channel
MNPNVLDEPAPGVRLMSFADNGLLFELRVWSSTLMHRKGLLVSSFNFAILEKFAEHGVRIPAPQLKVNIVDQHSINPFEAKS